MNPIPDRASLDRHIGRPLELIGGDGNTLEVELCGVRDAAALDDSYVCYVAEIRLPQGSRVEQGTYGLSSAQGEGWQLFFTPTRPDKDGRARMEAVIHVNRM